MIKIMILTLIILMEKNIKIMRRIMIIIFKETVIIIIIKI